MRAAFMSKNTIRSALYRYTSKIDWRQNSGVRELSKFILNPYFFQVWLPFYMSFHWKQQPFDLIIILKKLHNSIHFYGIFLWNKLCSVYSLSTLHSCISDTRCTSHTLPLSDKRQDRILSFLLGILFFQP